MWKLASALHKKYILLLTTTPIQNNLDELYNLVTVLQPGLLSTAFAGCLVPGLIGAIEAIEDMGQGFR